jgi:hypothetical protein
MSTPKTRRQRLFACGAAALLLCLAGWTGPAAAQAPAAPGGTARVWFYRVFFPGDTMGAPAVRMNGQIVGFAVPGVRFYRDVPAGRYHVTVDSYGVDVNQAKDVALVPGEELILTIQSAPDWASDGSRHPYRRPTYYVGIIPAQLAQAEMAETRLGTGQ